MWGVFIGRKQGCVCWQKTSQSSPTQIVEHTLPPCASPDTCVCVFLWSLTLTNQTMIRSIIYRTHTHSTIKTWATSHEHVPELRGRDPLRQSLNHYCVCFLRHLARPLLPAVPAQPLICGGGNGGSGAGGVWKHHVASFGLRHLERHFGA